MSSDLLFVANWKMQLSHTQSIAYIQNNAQRLASLAQKHAIVFCPSFDALSSIEKLITQNNAFLGAQDVSTHSRGAYTGQVSATSLKEVGCTYCIVGHSERRQYNNETTEIIEHKIKQLASQQITPIICIGETHEQRAQGITIKSLQAQLDPLIMAAKEARLTQICIAYEPVWAIGSGTIPAHNEIQEVTAWIDQSLESAAPEIDQRILYGGSVTSENVINLASIAGIGGFLVGGASTDFQKFEKIVSLENK